MRGADGDGECERMTSEEEVSSFIRSSFRSVWSLELLLLLRREPRNWSHEELVSALRASDLVVSQALEMLCIAGLVAVDDKGNGIYSPTPGAGALVDGAALLYARSPDAVRRLIVDRKVSGLTAFADAFRLRKE
jgi:hypothetical protein